MIYTVTLNPAVDRELTVDEITFNTVLRASDLRIDCGGKGFNVARMLKSLKVSSLALGFAAGKNGDFLKTALQSLKINTDFVWVKGETRTNVSIVRAGHDSYIKVNEPGPVISKANTKDLLQKIETLVQHGDWWILAGSLPPGISPDIYTRMTSLLKSAGAKVILDTSGPGLKKNFEAKPFLVKPNDAEASAVTGLEVDTPAQIVKTARKIQKMGPTHVIVSLGKAGAILVDSDETWLASSPEIIEKNPIGAGDSMVAGIVWGLSSGSDMKEALRRGIACGAATASKSGTELGSLEQINQLLPQIKMTRI